MRLFTLIVAFLSLLILGCSTPVASPDVAANAECRTEAQSPPVDLSTREQQTAAVLDAVAAARLDDLRCGPPPVMVRLCRALFVIATVDPAKNLEDQQQLRRSVDAIQWVTDDASQVAPSDLDEALTHISSTTQALLTAADESARARAVMDRAAHPVHETLDRFWNELCL